MDLWTGGSKRNRRDELQTEEVQIETRRDGNREPVWSRWIRGETENNSVIDRERKQRLVKSPNRRL